MSAWPESSGYLEKLDQEEAAPISVMDLLGIAPDFTGGLSVDEYMNEQRDRGFE